MRHVRIDQVPEQEYRSPSGKYHTFYREVSVALGREPDSMDLMKRHPFDVEFSRIPPGGVLCPYHSHSAQWELYIAVAGRAQVRHADGVTEVGPGESFVFPPGEPHQMSNTGTEDFVYYCIADNPVGESCYYPDSGKWLVRKGSERVIVKGEETHYYDGEGDTA
jgi:uncharacterized cupin superfamily protein